MQPETPDQLASFVRDATRVTVHSRVKVEGQTSIDLTAFNTVIEYPADDMTITVGSGMTVASLQATLGTNNQHIPIDIPSPETTSIGDAIAWNLSGSRRFGYGTLRDHVIGISAIDGRGRQFKSGGRVVKNVAGYDLCKLLIGSHGTLGMITQVTLRVFPVPAAMAGVRFTFDSLSSINDVLEKATTSKTRPIVIDIASDSQAHSLIFAYDGGDSEIAWQQQQISNEILAEPTLLSQTELRSHLDRSLSLSNAGPNRFRGGLPPSAVCRFLQQADSRNVIAHAGNGIVIGETNSLHAICSMAQGLVGWCRSNEPDAQPFAGAVTSPTMRKIKSVFDPDAKLNPQIAIG